MAVTFHDPRVREVLQREVLTCLMGFRRMRQLTVRLKESCATAIPAG